MMNPNPSLADLADRVAYQQHQIDALVVGVIVVVVLLLIQGIAGLIERGSRRG